MGYGEYVPAINYAHSHELLKRGVVDLITVGAFGGYQRCRLRRKHNR